jgi:cell division protein FtsB
VTGSRGETPAERIAGWTSTDAAIGLAAEREQLQAQLAERLTEIADLRARLANLSNRVAQLESDNADLRLVPGRVVMGKLARRVYRKARSAAAARLPR